LERTDFSVAGARPRPVSSGERVIEEIEIRTALGALDDVHLRHAPERLYVQGDASLLRRGPRVSIVGSRAASEAGLARARSLAKTFARSGVVVVSGLAAGIDTAAHESAIDHGGRTIAVIGTPLDQSYPKENAALQARIAAEHLVVSQFPSGTPATPKNFPIRNRTMALLSDATVIVEASENSGTRHQGWEALRLGRLVFLLENVASDPSLSWPAEMMRHGAQVLSRENLARVIENLPSMSGAADLALAT
jgi:DNA processing protein